MAPGIINHRHIAQRFEALLEIYRRPDGRRWSGQEIDEATGGVVTRSYITNLRKGRIDNPGYAKLAAMAKAMGFPPEVWFEDGLSKKRSIGQAEVSYGVAGRLEHLFEVVRNPRTGGPYTNAEVARMTLGDLSEEDVEKIRPAPLVTRLWGRSRHWRASSVWSHPTFWIGGNRLYWMKNSCRRYGTRTWET
jgi:transcriptional regulator with XRE-family HTH domain